MCKNQKQQICHTANKRAQPTLGQRATCNKQGVQVLNSLYNGCFPLLLLTYIAATQLKWLLLLLLLFFFIICLALLLLLLLMYLITQTAEITITAHLLYTNNSNAMIVATTMCALQLQQSTARMRACPSVTDKFCGCVRAAYIIMRMRMRNAALLLRFLLPPAYGNTQYFWSICAHAALPRFRICISI